MWWLLACNGVIRCGAFCYVGEHDGFAESVCSGLRRKSRGGGHWSPDDYDVRDSHRKVVGRIMLHPQAPEDQPWFWTITAREIPPSVYNHGYSATREQAMADFKKQWSN
jgi:hypothetical protein